MTQRHLWSCSRPSEARARALLGLVFVLGAAGAGLGGCAGSREPAPRHATSATAASEPEGGVAPASEEEEAVGHSGGGDAQSMPSSAAVADEGAASGDAYARLVRTEQDYLSLLEGDAAPDCPEAERLVQRICLLAARVCSLDDGEGEASCADAEGRCERAGDRLRRACGGR